MKAVAAAFLLAMSAVVVSAQTVDSPNGELLRLPDGTFVGASNSGGTDNYGTLFRVSANADITVLTSFTGDIGLAKGANPRAGLVRDPAGLLWGTTEQGGDGSLGTVFKFNLASRKLTTVVQFDGAAKGSHPATALVRDAAGDFLGTTRSGGTNGFGTVFKVNKTTGVLTKLVDFTGTTGAFKGSDPQGALYIDGAGVIWGTTSAGGAGDLGTVFKLDGATFTTVIEFTGTAGLRPGTSPEAALFPSTGKLWGTTARGGTSDKGTIFTVDPVALTFVSAVSFTGANGENPRGPLISGTAGTLLGTTEKGGTSNLGTIFSLLESTRVLTTITHFTGSGPSGNGAYPRGGLTVDVLPAFVGTTSAGGRLDTGLVFTLSGTTFGGTIDSNPVAGPKPPTIQPPKSTTGAPGVPLVLTGSLDDDPSITAVLVSINDGPFLTATILPGPNGTKPTWSLSVTPENGTNVIVVKTINADGGVSLPKTITFEFTSIRPAIIGAYSGIALPVLAGPPLPFSGLLTVNVLPTGRFTGKLLLGGLVKPVTLKGTFANSGVARFGKTATPLLIIPRKGTSPLSLELALDSTLPFTGILSGTVSENSTAAATIDAAQGLYSAKKNAPAPFIKVPTTLLDATSKGAYTGVFRALAPTPSLPADQFPQGDGVATLKLAATGLVKIVAELADGTTVSAGGPLVGTQAGTDRLPFFAPAYKKRGALTGEILFRDIAGQTDADGTAILWIRPPQPTAGNYRAGWSADGLAVDFEGSKFVAPKTGTTTPLGNAPSSTTANALLTLSAGNLTASTAFQLAIGDGGKTLVITPSAPLLKPTLSKAGLVGGSFTHPGTNLPTPLVGIVLQKQQTAAGYFLTGPTKTGDQKSGLLEIIKQP